MNQRPNVKLLAVDLDGTLVGADLQIRPRVIDAIAQARERGIYGCIVTGRMFQAALPYVRQLEFDRPVICYQGAAIVDPNSDEVLQHVALDNSLVLEISKRVLADRMHLQLYANDHFYVQEENEFSAFYARLSGVRPILVDSLLEKFRFSDATKIVVIDRPERAKSYAQTLQATFGDRAYITRSFPEFVEILSRDVDKGQALRFVAAHAGVPTEEVLAIGDSWNDVPLLRAAGFGIAMASSPPELLEVADAVVPDVAHDGVAEAIERYVNA
ncbi:MAG: HAD family phosphatase [Candidatus Eremiobacteraeota bacterium]|nr:HAD family phosphatase [Candidatus Eremiobacteraeota bacterium]